MWLQYLSLFKDLSNKVHEVRARTTDTNIISKSSGVMFAMVNIYLSSSLFRTTPQKNWVVGDGKLWLDYRNFKARVRVTKLRVPKIMLLLKLHLNIICFIFRTFT